MKYIARDTKNTVTITCYTLHNRFRLLLFHFISAARVPGYEYCEYVLYEESQSRVLASNRAHRVNHTHKIRMKDDSYSARFFVSFKLTIGFAFLV